MLRALSGVRTACTHWLRAASTSAPEAAAEVAPGLEQMEKTIKAAARVASGEDEAVPQTGEDLHENPFKHNKLYITQALAELKLDQYPFYVEREWWKKGKRMTFWSTWRMLRDVKRREMIQVMGADRVRLKALKSNTILPQAIRDQAADEMFNLPKYSHPRLVLNMCMLTGRQRGKIKPYRVSRHMFRKFADHSQLSGVQRAMW